MKTNEDLAELFEQARRATPEAPASKLLSLVEQGKTSPLAAKHSLRPRRIMQFFNPLKILIMITPIVIITSALLILNPSIKEDKKVIEKQNLTEIAPSINSKKVEMPSATVEKLKTLVSNQRNDKTEMVQDKSPESNGTQAINVQGPAIISIDTLHDPKNTLRLSSDVFKCFGFSFDQGGFSFVLRRDNKWQNFSLGVKGKEGFSEANGIEDAVPPAFPSLCLLSVHYRKGGKIQFFQMGSVSDLSKQDSTLAESFNPINPSADLFLPVKIIDTTLSEKVQNCIFWIYPNERFFACLPTEIGVPMLKEFNFQRKRLDPNFVPIMDGAVGVGVWLITKPSGLASGIESAVDQRKNAKVKENTEPAPCVYFTNLCESLPGLDFVNLYPNPATDKLNVEIVIQQAKKIRYRVFDMAGRILSDDGSPENYTEGGKFTYQMDISKLQSGFYLLILTDELGAKLTRRFVKN